VLLQRVRNSRGAKEKVFDGWDTWMDKRLNKQFLFFNYIHSTLFIVHNVFVAEISKQKEISFLRRQRIVFFFCSFPTRFE
jgi:hypothetical protein